MSKAAKSLRYPFEYHSQKIPSGVAICRSPLEADVFLSLDLDTRVIRYVSEPFNLSYEYEGTPYLYVPDVLIEYSDNSKKLVEVKTIMDIKDPIVRAKLTTAKHYCDKKGIKFEIWIRKNPGALSYTFTGEFESWEEARAKLDELERGTRMERIGNALMDVIKLLLTLGVVAYFVYQLVKYIF